MNPPSRPPENFEKALFKGHVRTFLKLLCQIYTEQRRNLLVKLPYEIWHGFHLSTCNHVKLFIFFLIIKVNEPSILKLPSTSLSALIDLTSNGECHM
jgi:hypothetical protein